MRVPSSLRLYHLLSRKRHPGKKDVSTKPKKKRVSNASTKLQVQNLDKLGCRCQCEVLLFRDPFDIVLDGPLVMGISLNAPVMMDMTPDRIIHVGRYIEGFLT